MKIGVDLDNTIICYDLAFSAAARKLALISQDSFVRKSDVRRLARSLPDGERVWRALQGQVYGPLISKARLFSGVYRMFWRCRARGFSISIVSHKTKFGHLDNSGTLLREVAIKFLTDHGLCSKDPLIPIEMISFFETREDKIAYIRDGQFDWLIDDLPEIIDSPFIPNETRKIGFCPDGSQKFDQGIPVASWGEAEGLILGAWTQDELLKLVSTVSTCKPAGAQWIGGGANSHVAKITFPERSNVALKVYAQDDVHDRYFSEQRAFELLSACGEERVPRALGGDSRLGVGLVSWIDGTGVDSPSSEDMDQVLEFLASLHRIRTNPGFQNFPKASAAVLSGLELQTQVEKRLFLLQSRAVEYPALFAFIQNQFKPLNEEIKARTRQSWPSNDFASNIAAEKLTLSPSDFGFHNCIRAENGRLIFLDFEYFGWDDPAKLCADFLTHPGMTLTVGMKRKWVEGVTQIYGVEMRKRLEVAFGLVGLAWCLIILNPFREDRSLARRIFNSESGGDSPSLLGDRLVSAEKLTRRLKASYDCFDSFLQQESESV